MGDMTLFDSQGNPVAYVDFDDEQTIYSFDGHPLGYVDEEANIYGFNGKHLGWFEDGIVWDHIGKRVGFTTSNCPVFTKFEPFKAFKQFKPFRAFKQFAPFRPFEGTGNANIPLLTFLQMGMK